MTSQKAHLTRGGIASLGFSGFLGTCSKVRQRKLGNGSVTIIPCSFSLQVSVNVRTYIKPTARTQNKNSGTSAAAATKIVIVSVGVCLLVFLFSTPFVSDVSPTFLIQLPCQTGRCRRITPNDFFQVIFCAHTQVGQQIRRRKITNFSEIEDLWKPLPSLSCGFLHGQF